MKHYDSIVPLGAAILCEEQKGGKRRGRNGLLLSLSLSLTLETQAIGESYARGNFRDLSRSRSTRLRSTDISNGPSPSAAPMGRRTRIYYVSLRINCYRKKETTRRTRLSPRRGDSIRSAVAINRSGETREARASASVTAHNRETLIG